MGSPVAAHQEREELEALLSSGFLARAPNLVLLLRYICEKYFAGQADQIKEYNIAVEALGRPAAFNQKQDSIVRVEASRLRRRLTQYYQTVGVHRELQIEVPNGQYVPRFTRREVALPAGHGETMRTAPPQEIAVIASAVVASAELAAADHSSLSTSASLVLAGKVPETGPRIARHRVFAMAIPVLCGVTILVYALDQGRGRIFQGVKAPVVEAAKPLTAFPPLANSEIRIIASPSVQQYVDHNGNYWTGDRFSFGGSLEPLAKGHIFRTSDYPAFSGSRFGEFSYELPAKPGKYELHLRFVESLYGDANLAGGGETSRLFNVTVNGQPILNAFDVYSDAGGANIADERVFRDVQPNGSGKVVVGFHTMKDVPMVSALELLPMEENHVRPVRILAQPEVLRQTNGVVWGGDRYFLGGQTLLRHGTVLGTGEADLYRGERYGRFSYDVPVPPGKYAVTLRFTEAWFGSGLPGGTGASRRLFNVFANGIALLRNLDVLKEAGGSNRALVKTFHGLEPDAQGKIELSFIPVQNYAFVNAIEVVDETR